VGSWIGKVRFWKTFVNYLFGSERDKVEIKPRELKGNWDTGWALDLHTISSRPIGDGRFDTTYTDIGKLLHRLKYKSDYSVLDIIANTAADFLKGHDYTDDLTCIIPIPPSELRRYQLVPEIAMTVSKKIRVPVKTDYLMKARVTPPMKILEGKRKRSESLKGAFKVKDESLAQCSVLLFDDLYRSGETLREVTHVLRTQGQIREIHVLTITKTRTMR